MRSNKIFTRFLIMVAILVLSVVLYMKQTKDSNTINNVIDSKNEDRSVFKEKTEEIVPVFSNNRLTEENIRRIDGMSWKTEAPVKLDDLRYIKVTYWGFDDKAHLGELVVHKEVSNEVIEIFKELYEVKFQIDKIKIIDEYNADDNLSMEDNNTSSFCFRVVAGTNKLSKHSYGLAIDINPIQNPYIKGEVILPAEGETYVDRSNVRKGMIVKDDACYKAFTNRGWAWGGEWKTVKDYQHFEKNVDLRKN
ncbi:M15 family metallopeptidase [Brassicibacter mesophilus]|uniref:M15 family metallopeptidase n=1 Tax=Brassicibacter mesophilus TaxID=745119 RepID=UPI003D2344F1